MNSEEEYSHKEERLRDKAVETSLALWGALLTVNGLFISAFSILGIFIKNINLEISVLIGSSLFVGIVSIFLLVLNFSSVKNMYIAIGQFINSPDYDLSESNRKSDIDKAMKEYSLINVRELIVKWLMLLEGIFILLIFILQVCEL